jgi:M6 family metalloprotease-like protein
MLNEAHLIPGAFVKKTIWFLLMLSVSVQGAVKPNERTVPDLDKLRVLRETRAKLAEPQPLFTPKALTLDAGTRGHVLVLLVEFGGTNTFTWTPGTSTWDPKGRAERDEWDGTNYNNAAASQFFADYYGIAAPTNFTYSGPLHNQIPRPPSGDSTNRQWNSIWYPDFSKSYYEQIAFGNGAVFDFNRADGSHYYANHTGISVSNYYAEMSSGAFALGGDVYGWITLTNSLMYYAADSVPGCLSVSESVYADLDTDGAIPGAGNSKSLVVDACRAAALKYPEINWADYDLDTNGVIDSLWIITAGFGEADGWLYDNSLSPESRIWPHSSWVYPTETIADGISVGPYIMNPENSGVYVLAHEYGHALGAIDLYAYQEGTLSPANWAIMHSSQSGFPEGFKPAPMDPYHLDGWSWLNPLSVTNPAVVTTVELYQAGRGRQVPAGMRRSARIKLDDQVVDLPVDPPAGKSKCWWGGNLSYDLRALQPNYVYIGGPNSSLSINTAYEMESGYDFMVVMVSYWDSSQGAWSAWAMLPNGNTVGQYTGAFSLPEPFAGLTGTSPGYPSYSTETYSLSGYAGKYVTYAIAYVTDGSTQLAGPFIGEVTLEPDDGYDPYVWSADVPADMGSDWWSVSGTYAVPHYYYLQWRNTGTNGVYDDVLGFASNRFGKSTSGLLTWYVNELYSDNEAPDYLADFPSYGAKGVALVVDAHPSVFRSDDLVWERPCTNSLAAYHNLYLNADATFGSRTTAVFPDGTNGALSGRPFFTDSRNYCAGAEYTYLNPTNVPPAFAWQAKKFDGSVVTPAKSAYGCRAPDMPDQTGIHRVWIDRDDEFQDAVEIAGAAGGTGNPLDAAGEYGWNFQVLEDKGTSAVVRIWNSHYTSPYPVLVERIGNGTTVPADDFLAAPGSNTFVQIHADEHHHIDRLVYNGTEVAAAVGASLYNLNLGAVSHNSSVYVFFAPDTVSGSEIPQQWFAEQGIPLTAGVLTQDSDGDGVSNEDEYAAGTKANDASSCLKLSTAKSGGNIELTWDSQWNRWYALEVSTNLLADPFHPVLGTVPGEYGSTRRTISVPGGNSVFYRVRLEPAP